MQGSIHMPEIHIDFFLNLPWLLVMERLNQVFITKCFCRILNMKYVWYDIGTRWVASEFFWGMLQMQSNTMMYLVTRQFRKFNLHPLCLCVNNTDYSEVFIEILASCFYLHASYALIYWYMLSMLILYWCKLRKHMDTRRHHEKLTAAVTQLLPPSVPALGFLVPFRHLSLVWQILLIQG